MMIIIPYGDTTSWTEWESYSYSYWFYLLFFYLFFPRCFTITVYIYFWLYFVLFSYPNLVLLTIISWPEIFRSIDTHHTTDSFVFPLSGSLLISSLWYEGKARQCINFSCLRSCLPIFYLFTVLVRNVRQLCDAYSVSPKGWRSAHRLVGEVVATSRREEEEEGSGAALSNISAPMKTSHIWHGFRKSLWHFKGYFSAPGGGLTLPKHRGPEKRHTWQPDWSTFWPLEIVDERGGSVWE